MSVALHPFLSEPENVHILSKLVVVDVSPTRAELSPEFKSYVKAMQLIERLKLRTRKEALQILEEYEAVCDSIPCSTGQLTRGEDMTVRQFLLTNLNPLTPNEPFAKFRVPLDILTDAIPEIGSFPYVPGERQWNGPTLFIKGSQSAYINKHSLAPIESFFPKSQLETLDTGHWVHGDRPVEFKELVENFIGKQY
ncbi:hypothetical protein C0992_004293 [Termitomyces sp. T32_za158]|nr:hypothetical protein C0992_004293 [Termitomyces sp. T32_za158]